MEEDDKTTVSELVKETISWLESNTLGDKEEFDSKYDEVEKVVQPIFAKLYGGAHEHHGGADEDMPSHDEL
eukprot:TRINITY_DN33_c0_g1_i1.p2 TRINITY_DN33_c0_g1~~TRINITY_DN33_c0_g1_i1.p2  ORF type:complete len:71 (-),score=44.47 TRINITY_DN33_c0_g1_i1:106-318(-)